MSTFMYDDSLANRTQAKKLREENAKLVEELDALNNFCQQQKSDSRDIASNQEGEAVPLPNGVSTQARRNIEEVQTKNEELIARVNNLEKVIAGAC
jgi:hypothetical protein